MTNTGQTELPQGLFLMRSAEVGLVELVGPENAQPRESILAVIVTREIWNWFFKLQGDADLVKRQLGRFESFVRSVRLNTTNESVNDVQ
jgi:hypothetical protein